MNEHNIQTPAAGIDNVQEPQLETENLEKENNNMYGIIGIIDGHYNVWPPKGLKKVKVIKSNKKIARDELKIGKL